MNAETTIPLLIFFEGMVGGVDGGVWWNADLFNRQETRRNCGNWEHGNRAISEGNKDTPVPPRGILTVFKENPAASHMTT